jgi:hypothetical protein
LGQWATCSRLPGGLLFLRSILHQLAAGYWRAASRDGVVNTPIIPQPETLSDTLRRVLIDIANRQPDPVEREAMLSILKKDGWL